MQHKEMAYLLEIESWRLKEDAERDIMLDCGWKYTDEEGLGWYCYKVGRMERLLLARSRLRLMTQEPQEPQKPREPREPWVA